MADLRRCTDCGIVLSLSPTKRQRCAPCVKLRNSRRARDAARQKAVQLRGIKLCQNCGAEAPGYWKLCAECRARPPEAPACRDCGGPREAGARYCAACAARRRNKAKYAARKEREKTDPEDAARRRKRRRAHKQARAAGGGPAVTITYLLARDRNHCGICHRKINPKLEYPHPLSASTDHVVPVSRGGTHVPENLQPAHLECNLAKRDGYTTCGEQLLLIG